MDLDSLCAVIEHAPVRAYVFEVTKITPTKTQTLAAATPLIQQTLTTQLQNSAASAINAQARKDWLSKTTCRAMYVVSSCSGYKKSAAGTG